MKTIKVVWKHRSTYNYSHSMVFSCVATEENEDILEDSQRISLCATNGVTYHSLCSLLQDTGNEGVAYVGECGSEECGGSSVSYGFSLN